MARHSWIDPSSFSFPGGPVGVLLIHGFTGSAAEMRPLGAYLADHGYAVLCPLLPGHGTQPQDLNQVSWRDWTGAVQAAYHQLAERTQQVFVGGLSLGGLLALHLAAAEPTLSGLLLFAPALRVFERLLPLTLLVRYVRPLLPRDEEAESDLVDPEAQSRLWYYEAYPVGGASQVWRLQRQVRRQLAQVRQPIILLQSRGDRSVRPDSPQAILRGVSSDDTRLIWLDNSGHNLVADAQRRQVFEACLAWIEQRRDRT